jgi:hypothetical protein
MAREKQIKLDPMEWRDAMKKVARAPVKKKPKTSRPKPASKKRRP